jgi:hypothetical protein
MSTVKQLVAVLGDGRGSAASAASVEHSLGMPTGHTPEPTRALIKEAIVGQDIPVGSDSSGYWLIDSQAELDRVVDLLQHRIDGLQARIDGLKRGWTRRDASRKAGGNWPR